MTSSNQRRELQAVAGALASYFAGGGGPSHGSIGTAVSIAGHSEADEDMQQNKQDRVLRAIRTAQTNLVRDVIEELVGILRDGGFLAAEPDRTVRLRRAFERAGWTLDEEGFISWSHSTLSQPAPPVFMPPTSSAPAAAPLITSVQQAADQTAVLLRRLPDAVWSLIRRQRNRAGLVVEDEYDLQDLVEVALRLHFRDVRGEEHSPSYAGKSGRIDFLLRQEEVAVEVKVTHPGRGEKQIRDELIIDFNEYSAHPSVKHVVAVVYDLAHTFKNPDGFVHDLTKAYGALTVTVVVATWPQGS